MENEPTGNVTQLNAHRKNHLAERQEIIRDHLRKAAERSAQDAPTAIVGISVQPDGHIRSLVLQVEPEHVIPVLSAMRLLMARLESCLAERIAARHLLLALVAVALIVADSVTDPAIAAFLR